MATIWYSTQYYVDVNFLGRYLFLFIEFDNLLLRLFWLQTNSIQHA